MTARKAYPVNAIPDVPVRPVVGYEGLYAVSEDGRLWSEVRHVPHKASGEILIGGRWLNPTPRRDGYLYAALLRGGIQQFMPMHRIVAMAWLPNTGLHVGKHVNHKNGLKQDNRSENLEWCTPSQNLSHAYRMGLRGRHPRSVSQSCLAAIADRLAAGVKQRDIATEYGLAESTISRIKQTLREAA